MLTFDNAVSSCERLAAAICSQVNFQARLIAGDNSRQLAVLNKRIEKQSSSLTEAGLWGTAAIALSSTVGTLFSIAVIPPDRTLRQVGSTVITGTLIGTIVGSAIAISLIVSQKRFLQRNQ